MRPGPTLSRSPPPGVIAVAVLVASALASPEAPAEEIRWRHRRLHPVDYAAAVGFGAAAIADRFVEESTAVRWRRGSVFDGRLRDEVALGSEGARTAAARASDVTLGLLSAQLAVDGAILWLAHDAPEAAWQVAWIDATALAFNVAVTGLIKRASGRDRPIQTACDADAGYDSSCAGRRPPRSFLSGHASSAFTAASLTCVHHAHMPIYGGDWDTVACVTGLAAAATVAWERMLADLHYASDVTAGAALGGLSGGLLPWLSFYAWDRPTAPASAWVPTPSVTVRGDGVRVMATW